MKVGITVMAHPARHIQANYLQAILRMFPFEEVSVTFDPVADGTHKSEWNNGVKALKKGIGKGFDYFCVIQDDAILTPYFYENLINALEKAPTKSLISLYTGKSRPMPQRITEAVKKARHGSFLEYWMLLWGVGIAIPADHIQPMLDFVADREEPYDTRIGIFYNSNRLPVYYTMPSLIDHDDSLGTVIPGHGTKPGARVAHNLSKGRVEFSSRVTLI